MKNFTRRFLVENKGVTAIEYGLIAGLIAMVIAVGVTSIGTDLESVFSSIATKLSSTTT
ncbi:Flp family type IVb pilin [Burkholderia sp. WAC0059]|nr:Flp family type IVb pilin [Burkholderia sp. WAC0059]PLZ03498.1 Flp family type IVb pilin [Burkholderia sp. WAC0059]